MSFTIEITKEELLNEIPNELKELKTFIENTNTYYQGSEENRLLAEFDFHGRQFLIVIDLKDKHINFVDDLVDFEKASNFTENKFDSDEWKERHIKLLNEVAKTGFVLRSAGTGGNDDYLWYELSIKADKFNAENLEKATQLWTHYNKMSRKLIGKDWGVKKRQCLFE